LDKPIDNIVTDGLVLYLDSSQLTSYPKSGTNWFNLYDNTNNGTLINGPTFNSADGGSIVFDGANDQVALSNITQNSNSSTTIEVLMKNNSDILTPNAAQMLFITNGSTSGAVDAYNQYTMSTAGTVPLIVLKSRMQYSSALSQYSYQVYYQILDINMNNYPVVVQRWYNPNGSLASSEIAYPQILNQTYHYVWSITNSDLGTRSIKHYLNGREITGIGSPHTADFNFFNKNNLALGLRSNSNIATLRLYNKPLSRTEITQNYQAVFPRILNEDIVYENLVIYLDAGYLPSYPTFGTSWYDVSGYGNRGVLTNGPTYSSDGGGSIVFDGVDDYVDCGNILFNNISTVTISIWVNIQTFRTNNSIISKGSQAEGSNSTFAVWIVPTTTSIRNRFYNNVGDSGFVTTPNNLSVNTWYSLTWTYDGATITGYLNGVSFGVASLTGVLKTNTNPLRIGRDLYGNNTPMTSSIVEIYNRALSSQEILQNYNAQKSRFGL
jgi:hypothetical protein